MGQILPIMINKQGNDRFEFIFFLEITPNWQFASPAMVLLDDPRRSSGP